MGGHVDLRSVGRKGGERSAIGPDLVKETSKKVDLIRKHLLTNQSQPKSYAEKRRRPLEF